jgi:hypothetical protein
MQAYCVEADCQSIIKASSQYVWFENLFVRLHNGKVRVHISSLPPALIHIITNKKEQDVLFIKLRRAGYISGNISGSYSKQQGMTNALTL